MLPLSPFVCFANLNASKLSAYCNSLTAFSHFPSWLVGSLGVDKPAITPFSCLVFSVFPREKCLPLFIEMSYVSLTALNGLTLYMFSLLGKELNRLRCFNKYVSGSLMYRKYHFSPISARPEPLSCSIQIQSVGCRSIKMPSDQNPTLDHS